MELLSLQLGARIKAIRKSRRLTQEQLAEKTAIDAKFLSQLELGKRNPSLGTVHKIACGLGIPVRELFESGPDSKVIRTELLRLVVTMDDETIWQAHRILMTLTER